MEYIGSRFIEKSIGVNYFARLDKATNKVSIFYKGKEKRIYNFNKYYLAVNFYAGLKQVKQFKTLLGQTR